MALKSSTQVIINVGTGGVGKTTVSAAMGLLYSSAGKKVLVITVDPSKRLATTLGLSYDGKIIKIDLPSLSGELWAGVMNSEFIFQEFVKKALKKGSAENILQNKLFQQLSTTLSGSQEFSALEFLYSHYEKNEFDFIILDTPPAQHAIEFLLAPRKISVLFGDQVIFWLSGAGEKLGFFSKLISTGSRKAVEALAILTGQDFINNLNDFFKIIKDSSGTLNHRTEEIFKLLRSEQTTFNLVTSPVQSKIQEAESLFAFLIGEGFKLNSIVVNRTVPEWIIEPTGSGSEVDQFLVKLNKYSLRRQKEIVKLKENFPSVKIFSLPEFEEDVNFVNDLFKVKRYLEPMLGEK